MGGLVLLVREKHYLGSSAVPGVESPGNLGGGMRLLEDSAVPGVTAPVNAGEGRRRGLSVFCPSEDCFILPNLRGRGMT